MQSSEHSNFDFPQLPLPPATPPTVPLQGPSDGSSSPFFPLMSPLFFCSQSWAPEHMSLPTYQYLLSFAVHCTPSVPPSGVHLLPLST